MNFEAQICLNKIDWYVLDFNGDWVAHYDGVLHPNAQLAATLEASQLNKNNREQ